MMRPSSVFQACALWVARVMQSPIQWCARAYARRIVNINVNILVAGALALAITAPVMHFVVDLEIDRHLGTKLHVQPHWIVTSLTFLVDLVADLAVYYVLHWWANHVPKRFGGTLIHPEFSDLTFMQDATKVQVERMILSPILYIVALGGQYMLHAGGMGVAWATAIGFTLGITTTRTLHTLGMLWEAHRKRRAAERKG